MKYKGTLTAQASGSLAGLTFSHNRGGQYIRARTTPVNPGSEFQTVIRDAMGQLTSRWLEVLDEGQRAGWDNYALIVQIPDSLGEPRNVGGLGMYARSNISRIQAGLAIVDTAPTELNLGTFTKPSVGEIDSVGQSFEIAFNESDAWVGEDGSAMLIYGSRSRSQSTNYFKGPFRFAVAILGNSSSPPVSPVEVLNPFPITAGGKFFVKSRVTRADGRLATEAIDPESLPVPESAIMDTTGAADILHIIFNQRLDNATEIVAADLLVRHSGDTWTPDNDGFVSAARRVTFNGFTSGLASAGQNVTYTPNTSDLATETGILVPGFMQFPMQLIT